MTVMGMAGRSLRKGDVLVVRGPDGEDCGATIHRCLVQHPAMAGEVWFEIYSDILDSFLKVPFYKDQVYRIVRETEIEKARAEQ